MRPSHFHLNVVDLPAALAWLDKIAGTQPLFENENMAVLPFGEVSYVLDKAKSDSEATIAFGVEDCDKAFAEFLARGAVALEEPQDYRWGVRSAYLQGPGKLTIELEQPLS